MKYYAPEKIATIATAAIEESLTTFEEVATSNVSIIRTIITSLLPSTESPIHRGLEHVRSTNF